MLFISGGLFLFTYHSTQFNLEGFIMVLSASVLSGLRWTLAQIVTQKNEIGKIMCEPLGKKFCHQDFQPGLTQTSLYSQRRRLEA